MSCALIDIRAVTKSYSTAGVATRVLFGVDLQVRRGEFVAVMGQSGSGKSTLMNILGCLDRPSGGSYLLDGVNTLALSRAALATIRNRSIGFVFQGFNLIKRMSVLENVALPLMYAGVARARATEKAREELERVGLADYAKRAPNQLSGGQQQRVAIARALVGDPPLVLADEPTGNLDTRTSVEIMRSFEQLNADRGITIIVVTHEPDIARYAQRLVRLKDGRVVFDGPSADGALLYDGSAAASALGAAV